MEALDVDLVPLKQELSRLIEMYNRFLQLKNDGDIPGSLQLHDRLCSMMLVTGRYLRRHRLLDMCIPFETNITVTKLFMILRERIQELIDIHNKLIDGGPLHIGPAETTSGRSV